jgi:hypothetical protein
MAVCGEISAATPPSSEKKLSVNIQYIAYYYGRISELCDLNAPGIVVCLSCGTLSQKFSLLFLARAEGTCALYRRVSE